MILENITTIQDLIVAINVSSDGLLGIIILYMIVIPFLFIVSLRTMSLLKSGFFAVVVGMIIAGLLVYLGVLAPTHFITLFASSVVLGILAFMYG